MFKSFDFTKYLNIKNLNHLVKCLIKRISSSETAFSAEYYLMDLRFILGTYFDQRVSHDVLTTFR